MWFSQVVRNWKSNLAAAVQSNTAKVVEAFHDDRVYRMEQVKARGHCAWLPNVGPLVGALCSWAGAGPSLRLPVPQAGLDQTFEQTP